MTEGTYNVSVKGLTEEALTGSVTVENEKVAEIKILSDVATIKRGSGDKILEVGYQVLNQYGEDVTKTTLPSLTFNSSKGTVAPEKGTMTITAESAFKVDDKVVVTAIDTNSAVTANTTLSVAATAVVSQVTLGEVYNEDGKQLTEDNLNEEFYLLVEGKDQYGKVVEDEDQLNDDLTILASNKAVVDAEEDAFVELEIKDEKKFGIKLSPKAKGESLVTVISNANGSTVSQKVTVAEGTKVDNVAIGTPEGTIAGSEKVLIPVEVTDNKGNAITKVADLGTTSVDVTNGTGARFVQKDGKLYVEATTGTVDENTVKNLIVSVTSETNKFSSKVFQVRPNAVATTITGLDSDIATSIFEGETITLKDEHFRVEDQYGRVFEGDVTITAESTNDAKILVDTDEDQNITVKAIEGNALITFGLEVVEEGKTKVISSVDVRFSTVAQAEFTSYKVGEVGTLYATDDTDYAKTLKVYGVTSTGKEVLLPSRLYNITSVNGLTYDIDEEGVVKLSGDDSKVDLDEATTSIPESKDATAKVVINRTGDELTVNAKISAVAPKAAKIELREDGTKTGKALSDVEINDAVLDVTDLTDLYVEDQYGVQATIVEKSVDFADEAVTTNQAIKLTFSSLVNADGDKGDAAPQITGNGTADASISNLETGDTVIVKVTIGSVSYSTTVKVGEIA